MAFTLPPLPYAKNALAPHISEETLDYHYGKHHQAYVTNLNKLVEGKPEASKIAGGHHPHQRGRHLQQRRADLEPHLLLALHEAGGGGSLPSGDLADAIKRDFGSFEKFTEELANAATTQFGSGWAWLVQGKDGKLSVTHTPNADLPMKHGQKALLTIDVWEHAYYIDYRNARPKYIETFLKSLVNWDFALENLKKG